MAQQPNECCEVCGAYATVGFVNRNEDREHQFCDEHQPAKVPGRSDTSFKLIRYRMAPCNEMSKRLNLPTGSEDHLSLQTELCDMQLLGADGACRYYLSVILNRDFFVAWSDEFDDELKNYVIAQFGDQSKCFAADASIAIVLFRYLRRAFESRYPAVPRHHVSKEEQAIEALLRHPDWSDEQIAREAKTTLNQLARWSDYQLARLLQRRSIRN